MVPLTRLNVAALLALVSLSTTGHAADKPNNAVLLKNVQSLTLRDGQLTSHRRVEAMPQLTCIGGSGCAHYAVDIMRCENSGSEYNKNDIQWTCKANLPSEFKLGSTDVLCEGYNNPDDSYILKGSCGVEYRLILTESGEQKYAKPILKKEGPGWEKPIEYEQHGENFFKEQLKAKHTKESSSSSTLFFLIFFAVLGFIVWNFVKDVIIPWLTGTTRPNRPQNRHPGGSGGGGWGGGDDNDPPPPYQPYQTSPKTKTPRTWKTSQQPAQGSNLRIGTYAGAAGVAAGAAAGYQYGRYAAQQQHQAREREHEEERLRNEAHARELERVRQLEQDMLRQERQRATSWWTGNNGGGYSAPSSSSSDRYESTGFGSTKRR